ncbi:MAG: 2-isopropylmalate synthase [Nitrosarchaeum sp.]|nr:2-isopropylmalate synthase [Nitrosarchaeum sp.]MCA9820216.1 2-isopropylmalate synthase [Nitrosarchaeum sp.]
MEKKYRRFINEGMNESLEKIPFHQKAPIKRFSMLNKSMVPESDTHIAVHFVNASQKIPKYSQLHKHNHDEINLILSEDDTLKYKIQLEGETYRVSSPSSVFIPKGVRHSAEVVSGTGIFVCIILSDDYDSSE